MLFCYAPANVLGVFYTLILLQILQGVYSLWDGWKWLGMVRRRLRTHPGFYAPRVALLCSCKGIEPGLEENLAALARFDYPDYEIFFIVASALDPARNLIEKIKATSPRSVRVVVAGPPKACGEKVNNLRAAMEKVEEAFEVIVFTDARANLGHSWLKRLVAPLADARIGAATTFRWHLPLRGGFWSALASAWNAGIATQLSEQRPGNFCWGGDIAIRRKHFDEARVLEFWEGAVSEDYAITRALRAAGLPILFVPECLAVTPGDMTADELLEFTNRQAIITRVYSPRFWWKAALTHLLYCAALVYAIALILDRIVTGETWTGLLFLTILVPLLAAMKGALRSIAVAELLPESRAKLQQGSWSLIALAPLVPFLYLWNFIVSAASRRIRWRGIRYQLISPSETRVLSR